MGLSEVAFALTDTVLTGLLLPLALLTGDTLLAFLSWHDGWYDKWKLFPYFSHFVPVYELTLNNKMHNTCIIMPFLLKIGIFSSLTPPSVGFGTDLRLAVYSQSCNCRRSRREVTCKHKRRELHSCISDCMQYI